MPLADRTATVWAGTGVASSTDGARLSATFNGPAGICFNASGSTMYVAEWEAGNIRTIDMATETTATLITGLNHPDFIRIHPTTGELWVMTGDNAQAADHFLDRYNATTGAHIAAFAPGHQQAKGFDFSPDGAYVFISYSADFFGGDRAGQISKYTVGGTHQWTVTSENGFVDPAGLSLDRDGTYAFVIFGDFADWTTRVNASDGGGNTAFDSGEAQEGARGLDVASSGPEYMCACYPRFGTCEVFALSAGVPTPAFSVLLDGRPAAVPAFHPNGKDLYLTADGLAPDEVTASAQYAVRNTRSHQILKVTYGAGWSVGQVRIG